VSHLCDALHMLGRYPRELDEARRARVRTPDQLAPVTWEVRALAALGRLPQLDRLIDESLATTASDQSPGVIWLVAAAELRAHGQRAAALAVAARAVGWYREQRESGPVADQARLAGLCEALCQAERWDEAYEVCRTLVAKAPQDQGHLGRLGCLAARRGLRAEAMRISEELRQMSGPYLFGEHTYRRACIAALLGEKQKAIDLLRQSFAEGLNQAPGLHREMDLEPLWDDPAFKELLRPKG